MFHMFQSAAFKALYKLGIFPVAQVALSNTIHGLLHLEDPLGQLLTCQSQVFPAKQLQTVRRSNAGKTPHIYYFFIKNLGSFQGTNFCLIKVEIIQLQPTKSPFLPKKKKTSGPVSFHPAGRLFRVSIGQVSADEAERNVIPFNATFVAMNGDFMIEQPWNLEQPGI